MIEITSRNAQRSLQREAGRQFDFFANRKDKELADAWAMIEQVTTEAIQTGSSLHLIVDGSTQNTPIIKPCEQGQQLPNNNVIKAFA